MADVYISLSQLLIALPIRDDDLNAAIKRKITRKLKHNPILDTPEAFNEIEGLVRSNYLDPRLAEETRIKKMKILKICSL